MPVSKVSAKWYVDINTFGCIHADRNVQYHGYSRTVGIAEICAKEPWILSPSSHSIGTELNRSALSMKFVVLSAKDFVSNAFRMAGSSD